MLKRLLRAARLSSALRTTLQSAEVSGIRQITSVGQPFDDVNIFMMLNRYAPCDSSSHKGSMEHVTSTSSSIPALMGHHSLLPATAAAIAELSKAGPVQLPSITESAYEDAVDDLLDDLPPSGPLMNWQCHTKRTFQPSLLVRKRRHGFLARISTRGGRKVIERRRQKGRQRLTA